MKEEQGMTRSATLFLALVLYSAELLPLCVGVKMEDFKVGLWGPTLLMHRIYRSFEAPDAGITCTAKVHAGGLMINLWCALRRSVQMQHSATV